MAWYCQALAAAGMCIGAGKRQRGVDGPLQRPRKAACRPPRVDSFPPLLPRLCRAPGPPGSAQAAGSARRKLRVYIRSEHFDQGGAGSAEEPPSWQLAVSGRLLGKADKGADKGGLDGECAAVPRYSGACSVR